MLAAKEQLKRQTVLLNFLKILGTGQLSLLSFKFRTEDVVRLK